MMPPVSSRFAAYDPKMDNAQSDHRDPIDEPTVSSHTMKPSDQSAPAEKHLSPSKPDRAIGIIPSSL
jgi:hypothetical protein